jgi:hypothetical protein
VSFQGYMVQSTIKYVVSAGSRVVDATVLLMVIDGTPDVNRR